MSKENTLRANQRKGKSLTAIHKDRDWVRDDTQGRIAKIVGTFARLNVGRAARRGEWPLEAPFEAQGEQGKRVTRWWQDSREDGDVKSPLQEAAHPILAGGAGF